MSDTREKILAEIGAEPVSGFYLRPGLERMIGRVEAAEPYPVPVVTSRDEVEGVAWPAPVLTLERAAQRFGWHVELAYARGRMPHATTGKPGEERDSFSVRFSGGPWQGYAIYAARAWQSIMVTGRTLPPFGMLGRTELGVWLAGPEKLDARWYDEVRLRRAQQEVDRKARDACNKGQHDQVLILDMVAGVWCRRCAHGWQAGQAPWRKPKGKGEAL